MVMYVCKECKNEFPCIFIGNNEYNKYFKPLLCPMLTLNKAIWVEVQDV